MDKFEKLRSVTLAYLRAQDALDQAQDDFFEACEPMDYLPECDSSRFWGLVAELQRSIVAKFDTSEDRRRSHVISEGTRVFCQQHPCSGLLASFIRAYEALSREIASHRDCFDDDISLIDIRAEAVILAGRQVVDSILSQTEDGDSVEIGKCIRKLPHPAGAIFAGDCKIVQTLYKHARVAITDWIDEEDR